MNEFLVGALRLIFGGGARMKYWWRRQELLCLSTILLKNILNVHAPGFGGRFLPVPRVLFCSHCKQTVFGSEEIACTGNRQPVKNYRPSRRSVPPGSRK